MKKSIAVGIVVIALAIVAVVVYIETRPTPPAPAATPPATTESGPQTVANTASNTASAPDTSSPVTNAKPTAKKTAPSKKSEISTSSTSSTVSTAEQYCANPAQGAVKPLAAAGGVVQIFEHAQALKDPYGCAAAYLKAGGHIDAIDPRADGDKLTPLLYAIKQNDPKMVRFALKHGADPNKRASTHHIAAYGYAIFLALHNQNVNYNPVIDLVNNALDQSPSSDNGS